MITNYILIISHNKIIFILTLISLVKLIIIIIITKQIILIVMIHLKQNLQFNQHQMDKIIKIF
jgi:hypothetical protein